jgi:hypothetical protein
MRYTQGYIIRYINGYMEGYTVATSLTVDNSKLNIDNGKMEEVDSYKTLQHKKKAFLAAFAETGNITAASKLSGISRQAHYDWMNDDLDYPALFKVADQQAAENLESEARRRAVQGVNKPVFYKGEECGAVREYSDTLLIFLLKGAMPDKYSEKFQGVVDHNIIVDDIPKSDRRARIAELLSKKQLDSAIDADYKVIEDKPAEPED